MIVLAVGIWGPSVINGMIGFPVGVARGIVDGAYIVNVVVGTMGGGEVIWIGNEVGTVVVRGFQVGR